MEKEEKNIIKTISYNSKMNKTQKNMKQLLSNLMKGLVFEFNEKQNNIKYEEYYFNGIPIPDNIEFKNISFTSFVITWSINEENYKNLNKNNIKYQIEIKKENELFSKIYEGNETNYQVNNLTRNTNYELILMILIVLF